ncbi:MAG: hypothetical protein K2L96_08960 [Muribaculaceae bacterium]|nr:hypothetical protein [Muribaculaceae bacterium]
MITRRLLPLLLLFVAMLPCAGSRVYEEPVQQALGVEDADLMSTSRDSVAAAEDTTNAAQPIPRSRRRVNPVNTVATRTQHINETRNDTSRINARRRAQSTTFTDEKGKVIFLDTVTGEQWIDSSLIARVPKMTKPLIYSGSVGVNIWDPVMRIFGQKYGLIDVWAQLNMHNRYLPVFEFGVGQTDNRPETSNYTIRVPASVYFRLGADYNFFYNSNPDYLMTAGVRYGFSPYKWGVKNIVLDSEYWGEVVDFEIPTQRATAGWFEFRFGVRVKIAGPISMGWNFRYAIMMHESKSAFGQSSYVPGFGSRTSGIGGTFSIIYTLPLSGLNKSKAPEVVNEENISPQ